MHLPTAIESDDRWLGIRRFFGWRITGTCCGVWTRGSWGGTWNGSPEWFPLGIARRWEFHRVFPSLMYPNRRPKPVKVTRWKHNSINLSREITHTIHKFVQTSHWVKRICHSIFRVLERNPKYFLRFRSGFWDFWNWRVLVNLIKDFELQCPFTVVTPNLKWTTEK